MLNCLLLLIVEAFKQLVPFVEILVILHGSSWEKRLPAKQKEKKKKIDLICY